MAKGTSKGTNWRRITLVAVVVLLIAMAFSMSGLANSSEVEVSTFAQLRAAMENANVTQINLAADITLSRGSITLNQNRSHLVVNGNGFTITQHSSNATADVIRLTRGGNLEEITFQNINIVGRNNSGFITVATGTAFRNVTLTFEGITYTGPQLVRAPDSRVILRDSNLTLSEGHLRKSGELVKASDIFLEGDVDIVNAAGGKGSLFRVFRSGGSFTVLEYANVNVQNAEAGSKTKTSGFVNFSNNNGTFTIAEHSVFNYTGGGTFLSGKPVRSVYIGTVAQVHIETVGTLNKNGLFNIRGTMTVQEDSVVDIIARDNTRKKTSVIQFAKGGTLEINNPESFFVFNSSRNGGKTGLAIGTGACTGTLRILYNEIESLEYWRLNSRPHTDLDEATFDWRNNNGEHFYAFLTFSSKRVTNVGTQNYYGETPFNTTTATLREINVIRITGGTLSHEVTFNTNEGTPIPPIQNVRDGRRVIEPPTPELPDFDFVGWYLDPDFDGAPWDFYNDLVTEEMTLHARWTPRNARSITYVHGAGGVGYGFVSVVPLGSQYVIQSYAAVNIGPYMGMYESFGIVFKFVSWNTEIGGTGITFNAGDVVYVSENIRLYAQWVMFIYESYQEVGQADYDKDSIDVEEDLYSDEANHIDETDSRDCYYEYAVSEDTKVSDCEQPNGMDEEAVSDEQYKNSYEDVSEENCEEVEECVREESYEDSYEEIHEDFCEEVSEESLI